MTDVDPGAVAAKAALRRHLASLPIEDKVRAVIRIQRLANEVRRATGRAERPAWPDPGEPEDPTAAADPGRPGR